MKKEFFKTAILTVLVISSLVLSANIWYEKELWSLDYSSFVYSLKNLFRNPRSGSFSNPDELIDWSEFSPEFLSFTYGSQKKVIYTASPVFEEADRMASEILASLKKEGSVSSLTEEEYLNTYKTNSLMLKFPTNINLTAYLKQEDGFFDSLKNPTASTLVIGIDDSQTNYLSFQDAISQKAYRLPITTVSDAAAIQNLIQEQNDSFAFELKFDVKKDDTNRILFNRFVPITLQKSQITAIKAQTIGYSSVYDAVFKAFRIVKNSARTYRDKENTIHFIENRSTLKIFDNGAFSFEANTPDSGISISKTSNHDEKHGILEFVNLLYRQITPGSDAFLSLWHMESKANETKYEFIYTTRNGSLFCKDMPAVAVTVKDNAIVKYEQLLLSAEVTKNIVTTAGVIEAYDSLYNQENISEKSKLTVKTMLPCFIFSENEASPGWICEFSDHSISYFLP